MSRKTVPSSVLLVLLCGALLSVPASAQHFQQVTGTLASVAAGRNEVFGIGPTGLPWRYNASKQSFEKVAGATSLVQIAVGGGTLSQLDEVWAVGDNGSVYRFNFAKNAFAQVPGKDFVQITVGEGPQDSCHPYEVLAVEGEAQVVTRYDYCTSQFEGQQGPVDQCTTDGGDIWCLTSSGNIWHLSFTAGGSSFGQVPGSLTGIAVGVDNVWGVYGLSLFRYDPITNQFNVLGGGYSQIAAGGDGLWGLAPDSSIYRFDPGTESWIQVPGLLAYITVGSGAGVWGVSSNNQVYTFVRP